MSIWDTSCNQMCHQGLLRTPSHMCHFYLMTEHHCACPTLWVSESENTQFVMDTSGIMVTCWPLIKHSFSTKAQKQGKSCFSKKEQLSTEGGRALLQNPKGLCCNSPIEACPNSIPICRCHSRDHMTQVAEQLAQQPGPVTEPSLSLSPPSILAVFRLLDKWA